MILNRPYSNIYYNGFGNNYFIFLLDKCIYSKYKNVVVVMINVEKNRKLNTKNG